MKEDWSGDGVEVGTKLQKAGKVPRRGRAWGPDFDRRWGEGVRRMDKSNFPHSAATANHGDATDEGQSSSSLVFRTNDANFLESCL